MTGRTRSPWSRCLLSGALLFSAACAASFDMSPEPVRPTPERGVVIGSVLVLPEHDESSGFHLARKAGSRTYKFEIVRIQPDDPYGNHFTAKKYDLLTRAEEEKAFVSMLPPGAYLIRAFRDTGLAGLGGDLDVVISVEAGEVRYVGRLELHVPHYLSRGKGYQFTIGNSRAETLARVEQHHPALTEHVVDVPMQTRKVVTP